MLSLTYYYSKEDPDQFGMADTVRSECLKNDLILVDICVDESLELVESYKNKTPVVCVGPFVLYYPFSETDLRVAIKSALDRQERLAIDDSKNYQKKVHNGLSITNLDRFSYFFSNYYAILISLLLAVFVLLPFLAPILAKENKTVGANIIYKTYHVLCHQLAFRSFYLFGEQAFYPRELAHIDSLLTYEQVTGNQSIDLEFARSFIGNDMLGFKVAICQRDVAIYGTMALFGIFFHFSKKWIKKIPWYWWFILALMPIAIDGASQIPSLASGWPTWFPYRESTPFLRVLTGSLFGVGTAWYMYPMMEESLKETRVLLHRKFAIIKKMNIAKNKDNDD